MMANFLLANQYHSSRSRCASSSTPPPHHSSYFDVLRFIGTLAIDMPLSSRTN